MGYYFYDTRIGKIHIEDGPEGITHVYLNNSPLPRHVDFHRTSLIEEAASQLESYLAGIRKDFTLPLSPEGTPFMLSVWALLRTIPYGKTVTYKQIAEETGHPGAFRAVGLACRRNALPIFIPCHRVVGTNGTLTGFSGGLDIKRKLLEIETGKA